MSCNSRCLVKDLLLGALAGGAATWVMGQVTTALYKLESDEIREREDAARGGETATAKAAELVADLGGVELNRSERKSVGKAIHWAVGVGFGALYGLACGRTPGIGAGYGLGYGTGIWLLLDEGANPLFGLTPGPTHFPWQTHARGLAGHLTYGLVTDAVYRVARQMTADGSSTAAARHERPAAFA